MRSACVCLIAGAEGSSRPNTAGLCRHANPSLSVGIKSAGKRFARARDRPNTPTSCPLRRLPTATRRPATRERFAPFPGPDAACPVESGPLAYRERRLALAGRHAGAHVRVADGLHEVGAVGADVRPNWQEWEVCRGERTAAGRVAPPQGTVDEAPQLTPGLGCCGYQNAATQLRSPRSPPEPPITMISLSASGAAVSSRSAWSSRFLSQTILPVALSVAMTRPA
jgi:hypothetical protein